jgi:GTP1/Obg family GTP-binding protein
MRNAKLERVITKIDNEIAAMNIAKKYLSNLEEINDVQITLNNKRQLLADELYAEDKKCYEECCDIIDEMIDKELGEEDQLDLLQTIKESFGRQAPNVSKKSSGLNAWLKELSIEYNWVKNEEIDWDVLVITGFGIYE